MWNVSETGDNSIFVARKGVVCSFTVDNTLLQWIANAWPVFAVTTWDSG